MPPATVKGRADRRGGKKGLLETQEWGLSLRRQSRRQEPDLPLQMWEDAARLGRCGVSLAVGNRRRKLLGSSDGAGVLETTVLSDVEASRTL